MLKLLIMFPEVISCASAIVSVITGVMALMHWRQDIKSIYHKRIFALSRNTFFGICIAFTVLFFLLGKLCVRVPNLYGETIIDAQKELEKIHLELTLPTGIRVDDQIDYKKVTRQNPAHGEIVFIGSVVTVFYDNTNAQVYEDVPDLVGKCYAEAKGILDTKQMRHNIMVLGEYKGPLEDLFVISQSIKPGAFIPEYSTIELELCETFASSDMASDDNMVVIPDLTGMNEQKAIELLESIDLEVQVFWPDGVDDKLEEYYIVNQSIPADSIVHKGTHIDLERSPIKPNTIVTVPSVVGLSQDDAIKILNGTGLRFQTWWIEDEQYNKNGNTYTVIEQSIEPNTQIEAGTTIRLRIGRY